MTEMSPAEAIFFAALERSPTERAAFLDQVCSGDADLRARIDRMLAAQSRLGGFLDQPPAQTVPAESQTGPPAEAAGVVIAGRYKLLQRIGEGGMGSIWMADQLEPVKRRVAVKLIHSDRGSSQTILARFEAERQAIALMDHPHIAKLLDAGTTTAAETPGIAAGQPYFVMELIKGIPLNDYCDQHKLSIADRLTLFTQICSAVQHAHQKGIIHRDLKPSNILVENHDDRAVPKVIDFGLAKALSGQALTERTLFTAFGTVAGTPLYMAPEQATFNAIDVDTRADIYALGVILYELLTGTTPIEREQLKTAGLDEVLRVIRENEPPTPSKRLSSTQTKPGVAANRQTEPVKLCRLLRGDLDWIVMKALAKERERRYETAGGLARDIERFLAHEPVLAGPPNAAYRLRKFVRRNRGQVLAGCLLLLALLLGLAGTTYGLIRAERRRVEAEKARAWAEKARDRTWEALDAMTSSVTGDSLSTQKAISDEQKKFLREVLSYYQEFAGEKADDEQSRARTAAAAFRVSFIESLLGRKTEAVAANRLALAGYAKLATDFPDVPEYRQRLARSHNNLGTLLHDLGKWPEAEQQYRQALAIQEKLAADYPAVPQYRQDLGSSHDSLGYLLRDLGKPLEAKEQFRQALSIGEKLAADLPAVPHHRQGVAASHNNLGALLAGLGKRSEAEQQYRQALAIHEKLAADFRGVPEYRQGLASCHNNLGNLLAGLGKRPDAQQQYRKALAIREKLTVDFPTVPQYQIDLGGSYCNLGNLVRTSGQQSESLVWYNKAIRTLTGVYEQDRRLAQAKQFLCNSYMGRAKAFDRLQQFARALEDWDRSVELSPKEDQSGYRAIRATLRLKAGQVAEAVAEVGELMKLPIGPQFAQVCFDLGNGLLARGKVEEAIACFRKAIELDPKDAKAHYNLGNALRGKGQVEEAIACYRKAIALDPKYAEAHCNLGGAMQRQGRFAESLAALKRGHELGSQRPDWPYPSAVWVRQAEQLAVLESRLPAYLKGELKPVDTTQRLGLITVCRARKLHHAAARLYADAFADPKLADEEKASHRYAAACCAALAASARGEDAARLDDEARAGLRKQALDWLRADLTVLTAGEVGRSRVARVLRHWQTDPDLFGIRDKAALDKLPVNEQKAFAQLWANVAATLPKAEDP
jgi:serine/threonine protein kinase/Tfp pilus assembly protein PilF